MKTKVPRKTMFSTEKAIRKIGFFLASDFQEALLDPSFCSNLQTVLVKGTVEEIRNANPEVDFDSDPYTFKCMFQMSSLLKRYRFQKDLYSDSELVEKAIAGFNETQSRIRQVDIPNLDASTKLVINLARIHMAHILGPYLDDECRERARFGKKASVGIPSSKASEAQRWEPSISGTLQQIAWFDSEMSQNPHVPNYWAQRLDSDPNRSIYQEVDALALTLVPKTFKSLRSIMPNTTIGSYQSYGIGEMIRVRLRDAGYDIRSLQDRHKYLAKLASECNLFVTADLSAASDSISRALVEALLPPDWFEIMDQNRVSKVRLPDHSIVESETFCTMGIGYTFPLQTLIFLCLLRAIEATTYGIGQRQLISVYGDDMIYSKGIHSNVVLHFSRMGFVINDEKTFVDGPFRESCGGDYHTGVDVRPFQPRNGQSLVSEKEYEAFLYKAINGLLRRWTEFELPATLSYLCRELSSVASIKLVPNDFPDDGGVKCCYPRLPQFLEGFPYSKPKVLGSGIFRFSFLRFQPKLRKEERHDPYYWLRLRSASVDDDFGYHHTCVRVGSAVSILVELVTGITETDRPSALISRKAQKVTSARRSCLTGERLGRIETFVVNHNTGSYHRQTGASMFEAR